MCGVYYIQVKDSDKIDPRVNTFIYGPHTGFLDGPPLSILKGKIFSGVTAISNYRIPIIGASLGVEG